MPSEHARQRVAIPNSVCTNIKNMEIAVRIAFKEIEQRSAATGGRDGDQWRRLIRTCRQKKARCKQRAKSIFLEENRGDRCIMLHRKIFS
ncbi:hypothetical protein [Massilia sp. TWR1-2-2]|uniref:hypothetical protein n=1 Tax=Massilia sp. TWR1-2-2 TaxID=2804584 RepID=UPI003CE6DC83